METRKYFICDRCEEPILGSGVIIQGNVYASNPENLEERGGIIGNNFPVNGVGDDSLEGVPLHAVVKENIYHLHCLVDILTPPYY